MSNINYNYLKATIWAWAFLVLNFGYSQSDLLESQFQLDFAGDCQITCSPLPDTIYCNESLNALPAPSVTNCGQVYSVDVVNETYVDDDFCGDDMLKLERTWQALDGDGNELSSCVQTIVIKRALFSFPKDIVWTYEQYSFNPLIIESTMLHESIFDLDTYDGENDVDVDPGLSDFAVLHSGSGLVKGGEDASCLYEVTYSDSIVIGCKQSFQVFRVWKALELCSGLTLTNIQKISIVDSSSNANLENSPGYVLNDSQQYEYHVDVNSGSCQSTDFILFPHFFNSADTSSIVVTIPLGTLVNITPEGGYIPLPGLEVGTYVDGLKIQVSDFCGDTETLLVTLVVDAPNEPQCSAPQNMTVSCVDLNADLSAYGSLSTTNGCGTAIDSTTNSVEWGAYDTVCHTGVITRYWSVWDADGNTGSCLQKITVVPPLFYSIQFPDDEMDGIPDTIAPIFSGNCGPTSWDVHDVKVIPSGQCLGKIYRTYTTFNDCDFNPNFQPEMVVNPENTPVGALGGATLQNHGVLSYTLVIDNFCDTRMVSGRIHLENGVGIDNVTVNAKSSDLSKPTFTTVTDALGYYSMKLPVASSYILKPEKLDDTHKNGVDMSDAMMLYKHILIIPKISSPYKILAANVLAENGAMVPELLEIKKLVLSKIDGFSHVPVWTFAESSVPFPDPMQPYAVHYASHQITQLQDDQVVKFVGIKYGDLDDSVIPLPTVSLSIMERSEDVAYLSLDDIFLKEGKEYQIPFNLLSEKSIMSYQFTLDFDIKSLEFLKLVADGDLITDDFNVENVKDGQLATAHIGQVLHDKPIFMIRFKAKTSGFLSQMLDVSNEIASSKAFDEELNPMKLELSYIPTNSRQTLILFQNEPNPFVEVTTIKFELQKEEKISLTIYSAEGQVVAHKEKLYPSGLHQEIFDGDIFKEKGIYFYRIETANYVYVKKMIKF